MWSLCHPLPPPQKGCPKIYAGSFHYLRFRWLVSITAILLYCRKIESVCASVCQNLVREELLMGSLHSEWRLLYKNQIVKPPVILEYSELVIHGHTQGGIVLVQINRGAGGGGGGEDIITIPDCWPMIATPGAE